MVVRFGILLVGIGHLANGVGNHMCSHWYIVIVIHSRECCGIENHCNEIGIDFGIGIGVVHCRLGIGILEFGIHGPFEPHSGRSQLGHRRSAVRHAEASGHWCRALAVRLMTIRCY